MPRVIIEGPDGSGKSFTTDHCRSVVNFPIFPTQGPPKNPTDIVRRVKNFFESDNMIYDRCPLISEMVYGPIIRGHYIFDRSWLNRFDYFRDIIIYCRPSSKTILSTKLSKKAHKPQKHLDEVIKNHPKIIQGYDSVMSFIPGVIKFNRDNQSLESLCVELTSRLEEIKRNS